MRPACLSKYLQVKLKCKKEMHRQCNQGHISWKGYRDTVGMCRDEIRKAKVQLELSLARDAKIHKNVLYEYVGKKRKIKKKKKKYTTPSK